MSVVFNGTSLKEKLLPIYIYIYIYIIYIYIYIYIYINEIALKTFLLHQETAQTLAIRTW